MPFKTGQENGTRSRGWSPYDPSIYPVNGIEIIQGGVASMINFIRGPEDASRKTNEST
jgi:hypothetical protein